MRRKMRWRRRRRKEEEEKEEQEEEKYLVWSSELCCIVFTFLRHEIRLRDSTAHVRYICPSLDYLTT
jgi:hypothetical protein